MINNLRWALIYIIDVLDKYTLDNEQRNWYLGLYEDSERYGKSNGEISIPKLCHSNLQN